MQKPSAYALRTPSKSSQTTQRKASNEPTSYQKFLAVSDRQKRSRLNRALASFYIFRHCVNIMAA